MSDVLWVYDGWIDGFHLLCYAILYPSSLLTVLFTNMSRLLISRCYLNVFLACYYLSCFRVCIYSIF